MEYVVRRTATPPALDGNWTSQVWEQANELHVDQFLDQSSSHRPQTDAKVLYDDTCVYVLFRVFDRHVRSVVTEYQGSVCGDSCVEFFVQPKADKGYLNFEINAGGALHVSYIEDATRLPEGGFVKYALLPQEDGDKVRIYHSLPEVVEPEVQEETEWFIEYAVPLALFEAYVGPLGPLAGQTWHANFYKCGDNTSHPHWACWSKVGALNFHRPQDFAPIRFEA